MFFGFDSYFFLLVLPALAFTIWAQCKVTSSFKKYSAQQTRSGITGAQAAQKVLNAAGVSGVQIEHIPGKLTDHFDPRANVIRLSDAVYNSTSVAAVGVAAHEAGHAVQYAQDYSPMKWRAAIIPVTNISSRIAPFLLLIGLFFEMMQLFYVGIVLFAVAVVFQLITLPVEFNASSRAMALLGDYRIIEAEELPGAKKVLSAAAMTYVGALAVSLAHLIRFIAIANRRR